MSSWGWRSERTADVRHHAASWVRPFSAAAPWLTVMLLVMMLYMAGGVFTVAKGVLFDLPDEAMGESEPAEMVALVMPTARETLVFFDDARYHLGDGASTQALGEHLAERVSRSRGKTLLVLADRRVAGGELMRLAALAKSSGAKRILFAEKRKEAEE